MTLFPLSFYLEDDVVSLAKKLLGAMLITQFDKKTAGIIVETECYRGVDDRASHAYNGRRTERTKTLYEEGGISYIYLCYGMHHLFNIVTNRKDCPHAVLVRAIEPVIGIETMMERRQKPFGYFLTNGPGSLCEALGLTKDHNGCSLLGPHISIESHKKILSKNIIASPRVGVGYAKEDALLPWRFRIENNPWTSKAK